MIVCNLHTTIAYELNNIKKWPEVLLTIKNYSKVNKFLRERYDNRSTSLHR